jgi:hypothetical protein
VGVFALSINSKAASYDFPATVTAWLQEEKIHWHAILVSADAEKQNRGGPCLLMIDNSFYLHLLPSPKSPQDCLPPRCTQSLTDRLVNKNNNDSVVHLHQDVWCDKTRIVQSRLLQKCGRVKERYFARKTTSRRITADVARTFLTTNHLWGFTRGKYYYGLFNNDTELVAAASFSSKRVIQRDGVDYNSHELIRFCTKLGANVVGGISKLIKAFVRDIQPDDIVTVVDRDWGTASSWNSLGFVTCQNLPPLVMVVDVELGLRRYLVGAGLGKNATLSNGRIGLDAVTLTELDQTSTADDALLCLYRNGMFPVYDAGVERLIMLVPGSDACRRRQVFTATVNCKCTTTVNYIWRQSTTQYSSSYYSDNSGVRALLAYAQQPTIIDVDFAWN